MTDPLPTAFVEILLRLTPEETAFLDRSYDMVTRAAERHGHPRGEPPRTLREDRHLGDPSSVFYLITEEFAQLGTSPELYELANGIIAHTVSLGLIEETHIPGRFGGVEDYHMTPLGTEFVRACRAAGRMGHHPAGDERAVVEKVQAPVEPTVAVTPKPALPRIGHAPQGGPVQSFYLRKGTERRPPITRGDGVYLFAQGRRYLDASSGPVVSNLGHGNRRVLEAMRVQAEKVTFAYPGLFESDANVALADLVCKLAGPGLDRAFFVSGGSEATEAAIKLARQHALAIGQPGRVTVIGREPSYHGATLGALAVTGDHHAEEIFGPLMKVMPKVPAPLSYRVPSGHTVESYAQACARALEDQIVRQGPDTVLAFIMEPVGGLASGAMVAPAAYYEEVRAICDRHGVLLIYDEVMSGAGRTGTFLAADHWPAVRPDLVTLAKGIAAGYTPFGAVLAPDRIVDAVVEAGGFMHGHTYFTNPLSCAVAHAVVCEMMDRDLIGNAARMGARLREGLEALAARSRIIGDVRGKGLLMAIELVADKASKQMLPPELVAPARLGALALEEGLALYSRRTSKGKYGDWVMITPPLIIEGGQVDELVELLERSVAAFERELAA